MGLERIRTRPAEGTAHDRDGLARRLFVGDRENNRIQIFDQDGKLLDEWRQFGRPSGIFIMKDDTIYVTDSESGPDTGAHELMGIKKGIRIRSRT